MGLISILRIILFQAGKIHSKLTCLISQEETMFRNFIANHELLMRTFPAAAPDFCYGTCVIQADALGLDE